MKIFVRVEQDDWVQDGKKITDAAALAAIRYTLEKLGPIIVQHWLYRRGSSPAHLIFADYDEFIEYLEKQAAAGDAIDIWSFSNVCTTDQILTEGKCPDDDGYIPKGGAY